MTLGISKIASLVIAIGYTVIALVEGGASGLACPIALFLPLALIWFPDEVGSFTGWFRGGYINKESPPALLSMMGWFFLVGLPTILYFLWR